MSWAPRVYELERLVGILTRRLDQVEARLAAVEQSNAKVWGLTFSGGTGGGATAFWCLSPGTGIAAATGAWPTLTPTEFTAEVYQDQGGALVEFDASATVRWWYQDAGGNNKLLGLIPNGDGTYDVYTESCTGITTAPIAGLARLGGGSVATFGSAFRVVA